MKLFKFMLIIIGAVLLTNCNLKEKNDVENSAKGFFQAYQKVDLPKMKEYYPDVDNIDIFVVSDTAIIERIMNIANDGFIVKANSFFLNEKGNLEIREIKLFMYPQKDNKDKYIIVDSYGICGCNNYPHYEFALNTGCVDKESKMTEQESIYRLRVAKDLLFYFSKKMYNELEENVMIVSSSINKQDKYRAYGDATVANKSEFTLPDLRYIIVYYNEDGKVIGEDGGWVTKKPFSSGESIRFDFMTDFAMDVVDASFKLDFDLELILQFVMTDDIYTGSEYDDFLSEKLQKI